MHAFKSRQYSQLQHLLLLYLHVSIRVQPLQHNPKIRPVVLYPIYEATFLSILTCSLLAALISPKTNPGQYSSGLKFHIYCGSSSTPIASKNQIVSVLRFQGFLIKQSHKSPLRTAPLPRHTRPSLYHQRPPCLSHAKQAVHPRPTLQERSLYHSSPVGILHTGVSQHRP